MNKDGRLFLWHANAIADGPFADVLLQKQSEDEPLLTQPAYDAATRSRVRRDVHLAGPGQPRRLLCRTRCVEGGVPAGDAAGLADRRRHHGLDRPVRRPGAAPRVRREDRAGRRRAAVRRDVLRAAEHRRRPALRGRASRLRHSDHDVPRVLGAPRRACAPTRASSTTAIAGRAGRTASSRPTTAVAAWRRIYPTYAQRVASALRDATA